MFNVAIDGPGGAGKSTAAKLVAKETGFHYVDTGAMYRSLGIWLCRAGVDVDDIETVAKLLPTLSVDVFYDEVSQHVTVNGEDMTPYIRTQEAGDAASRVSVHPEVRAFLLDLQKGLGKRYNVIMDGRDIGTCILPNADLKVFITAAPEERGRRRYAELLEKGDTSKSLEQIIEEIKERDYRDTHREAAPLRQAEDARFLDTTNMTLDEVKDTILGWIREIQAQQAEAEQPRTGDEERKRKGCLFNRRKHD